MRLSQKKRVVRSFALALLAFVAFEACSSSSSDSSAQPDGPPAFAITQPIPALACDDSLVVSLTLTNIKPQPPGTCGTTPQCGSVSVSLLETQAGSPLIPAVRAATADVQLDLSSLVSPPSAGAPTLDQVHFVKAELFNDSLDPYSFGGAILQDIQPITLSPPTDCSGAAGAPNAGGAAGAAEGGASSAGASGEGGASGSAGAPEGGSGEAGGSGGSDQGGTAGSAQGGVSGAAGSAQGGVSGAAQGGSGG